MEWITAGVVMLCVLILGVSAFLAEIIIHPKRYSTEQTYSIERDTGKLVEDIFTQLPQEEVWIPSPYGYLLYGLYFPLEGAKKTVVICHGFTYTLFGSVKYMDIFRKRGFNILLYDHRYHGRSGGKNCTFGYYEKNDLKVVVDWVYQHCGDTCEVGIHGESMGAGIALQYAAIDERPRWLIADCGFSDLKKLLRIRLKMDYHLPSFPFLALADWFCRLQTGACMNQISPLATIDQVHIPILFIHGDCDRYIPKEMSMDMYARKPGDKAIYIAPEAGHADSYWKNRIAYDKIVGDFIQKYHS